MDKMIAAVSNPYTLVAFALAITLMLVRMKQPAKQRQLLVGSSFLLAAGIAIAGMWLLSGDRQEPSKITSNPAVDAVEPSRPASDIRQTSHGDQSPNVANVGGNVVINNTSSENH